MLYVREVGQEATGREWAGYVVAMTMGATVNYGAFAATLLLIPFARHQPWVGVAVGSVAGLAVNYLASRLIVFRGRVGGAAGNGKSGDSRRDR